MSSTIIQNNDLQLLAIPQLMKKHFFIPDYQRGYRWEETQVFQLLKDFSKYFDEGHKHSIGFYCLQPIVVKECSQRTIIDYKLDDLSALPAYDEDNPEQKGPKNNIWYEVIDGQQRLTTIRILLAFHQVWNYMNIEPFVLKYATRSDFSKIFDHLLINPWQMSFNIDNAFVFKNVDVEYVRSCGQSIIEWFKDKKNEFGWFLSDFYRDASQDVSVQVIWYETKESTDARDIFERLNNLKVPLSSSELIRALFLSENAEYGCSLTPLQQQLSEPEQRIIQVEDKRKKQSSINAKWDEIEHFFQNDKLWAFITNRDAANYRNRIELLFDFMSEKYTKGEAAEKDRLFTYLYFDAQKKDLWDLWEDVVRNYDCIRFWYEQRDYYHMIGYLIHERQDRILIDLLKFANSQNHKKSEFDEKLSKEIKDTIKTNKTFNALSYDDARNDYNVLKSLLFLYNVELTRVTSKEGWFPFDEYKRVEKEKKWTLEHIHAQNSQCLDANKRTEWRDWIAYTLAARESMISPSEKEKLFMTELSKMKEKLDSDIRLGGNTVKYDAIVDLFLQDLQLWSGGQADVVEHQLSNLALLSGDVNSGIGKGAFSVKQQYINKCIADGTYIPIGTQKVFLKHYYEKPADNPTDDQQSKRNELLKQQLLTWDKQDRDAYYASIVTILSNYFSKNKF